MKVGDLVVFVGSTCSDVENPGVGTVVDGPVTSKPWSSGKVDGAVEVAWPKLGIIKWHYKKHLEVLSESQ